MRQTVRRWLGEATAIPIVAMVVMAVTFYVMAHHMDRPITTANGYDILQNFAQLGLVALAIALTMVAGEFDLSVPSMYGLAGTVAVLTGDSSPVLGVLIAIGVAILVGVVQGGLVAGLKISSVPITLGGYLILSGLTYILCHNNSIGYPRFDVSARLDKPIYEVFSLRSLIAIGGFVLVTIVLSLTKVGAELRATGGNRRAARVAGVPVRFVLMGTFVACSVLAALSGALQSYALAGTSPNFQLTPLIFAVTAAVLGGVRLEGGVGTPLGVAAGVLALSLLQEGLVVVNATDSMSEMVTGGLLALVALISAPDLRTYGNRLRRNVFGREQLGRPQPDA